MVYVVGLLGPLQAHNLPPSHRVLLLRYIHVMLHQRAMLEMLKRVGNICRYPQAPYGSNYTYCRYLALSKPSG